MNFICYTDTIIFSISIFSITPGVSFDRTHISLLDVLRGLHPHQDLKSVRTNTFALCCRLWGKFLSIIVTPINPVYFDLDRLPQEFADKPFIMWDSLQLMPLLAVQANILLSGC